jgi:hypothetical protein
MQLPTLTSQPSLNCRLQSAKPGEQVGAHVPPLQVPPEVPGLPAQVVPQAPQLVALVLVFTCTSACRKMWVSRASARQGM